MLHRIQTISWNKMKPKHTTIQEWLQNLIQLKTHGLVRTGTLIKVAVISYLRGPKPLIKRCSHAGEYNGNFRHITVRIVCYEE